MSKHGSFYIRQYGPRTIPLCPLPFFGLNTRKIPCVQKWHGISLHRKKIESDPHYYHATLPTFSSSKHSWVIQAGVYDPVSPRRIWYCRRGAYHHNNGMFLRIILRIRVSSELFRSVNFDGYVRLSLTSNKVRSQNVAKKWGGRGNEPERLPTKHPQSLTSHYGWMILETYFRRC